MKVSLLLSLLCLFALSACSSLDKDYGKRWTVSGEKKLKYADITETLNASGQLAETWVVWHTPVELKSHNTKENCWISLGGETYEITSMSGQKEYASLMKFCGNDASEFFSGSKNPNTLKQVQLHKNGIIVERKMKQNNESSEKPIQVIAY